jgi:hypothetical protein
LVYDAGFWRDVTTRQPLSEREVKEHRLELVRHPGDLVSGVTYFPTGDRDDYLYLHGAWRYALTGELASRFEVVAAGYRWTAPEPPRECGRPSADASYEVEFTAGEWRRKDTGQALSVEEMDRRGLDYYSGRQRATGSTPMGGYAYYPDDSLDDYGDDDSDDDYGAPGSGWGGGRAATGRDPWNKGVSHTVADQPQGPLRKDGQPDMRYKGNWGDRR